MEVNRLSNFDVLLKCTSECTLSGLSFSYLISLSDSVYKELEDDSTARTFSTSAAASRLEFLSEQSTITFIIVRSAYSLWDITHSLILIVSVRFLLSTKSLFCLIRLSLSIFKCYFTLMSSKFLRIYCSSTFWSLRTRMMFVCLSFLSSIWTTLKMLLALRLSASFYCSTAVTLVSISEIFYTTSSIPGTNKFSSSTYIYSPFSTICCTNFNLPGSAHILTTFVNKLSMLPLNRTGSTQAGTGLL